MPVSDKKLSEVIYDLLPQLYKDEDKLAKPIPLPLKRFLQVASIGLERSEKKIDELGLLYNIDTVDKKYLPHLSNMLGFEMPKGSTEEEMRRLIRNLPELYRLKGNDKIFKMLATLIFYDEAKSHTEWRHRGVNDEGYGTTQLNIVLELIEELVTDDIQGKIDRYNELANFFRPVNVQFSWLIVFYYLEIYQWKENPIEYLDLVKEITEFKKLRPNLVTEFDLLKDFGSSVFDRSNTKEIYTLDTLKYWYQEDYEKEIVEREMLKIFMDDNLPGDYNYLNDLYLNNHGIYPYRYKLERYNPMKIVEALALDTPMFMDVDAYSKKWVGEGILNKSIPIILNGERENFDLIYYLAKDVYSKQIVEKEPVAKIEVLTQEDNFTRQLYDLPTMSRTNNDGINRLKINAYHDPIHVRAVHEDNGKVFRSDSVGILNVAEKLNGGFVLGTEKWDNVSINETNNDVYEIETQEEESTVFVNDLEIAISNWEGRDVYDYFGNRLNSSTGVNFFTTASFTITRDKMVDSFDDERKVVRNDTLGTINQERTNSLTLNGFLLFGEKTRTTSYDTRTVLRDSDLETNRISDVLLDKSERISKDYSAGTINSNTLNAFTLLSVVDKMVTDVDEGEEKSDKYIVDYGGSIGQSTLNNMLLTSKIEKDVLSGEESGDTYGFKVDDDFVDEIIYL